jgi:hypothetical protein
MSRFLGLHGWVVRGSLRPAPVDGVCGYMLSWELAVSHIHFV